MQWNISISDVSLFRNDFCLSVKFPSQFKALDFLTSFHAMTVVPGIRFPLGGKPHPPCNLVTVRSNKHLT